MHDHLEALRKAALGNNIEWRRHVLERMVARGISRECVMEVLESGEPVEDYPGDYPLPSCLLMGQPSGKALHVVAAWDAGSSTVYVITAYEPDSTRFEDDLRTRRRD